MGDRNRRNIFVPGGKCIDGYEGEEAPVIPQLCAGGWQPFLRGVEFGFESGCPMFVPQLRMRGFGVVFEA